MAGCWLGAILHCQVFLFQIIKVLLAAGADMNVCESEAGQSPLFAALQHKYTEIATMLVESGQKLLRT